MKKIFKSGVKDMKQVFNQFRKLSDTEKAALVSEHGQELKEYKTKCRTFLETLPISRHDDYKLLRNRGNSNTTTSNTNSNKSTSRNSDSGTVASRSKKLRSN